MMFLLGLGSDLIPLASVLAGCCTWVYGRGPVLLDPNPGLFRPGSPDRVHGAPCRVPAPPRCVLRPGLPMGDGAAPEGVVPQSVGVVRARPAGAAYPGPGRTPAGHEGCAVFDPLQGLP